MTQAAAQPKCYLYAIIPADAHVPDDLVGLEGMVSTIRYRQIAAVVGDLPSRPLGNRADLQAHERVVATVSQGTTVVPARFAGAVASMESLVDEILSPYHNQLVATLRKLKGLHQFTLYAEYESDVILREIVTSNEEIGRLRKEILRIGPERSYPKRIRQGELIVQGLQHARRLDSEQIRGTLEGLAESSAEQEPGRPDEVAHISYLVADSKQDEFEEAVEQIGRAQAGRMQLRLLGPLPPYDFVPGM